MHKSSLITAAMILAVATAATASIRAEDQTESPSSRPPVAGEPGGAKAVRSARAATVKNFQIDAPRLARALIQLTEQSGLQLIYPAGDKITDLPAKPLKGRFTTEDALKQLLEDTGLEYEFIDARTISIVDPKKKPAARNTPVEEGGSSALVKLAQNMGAPDVGHAFSGDTSGATAAGLQEDEDSPGGAGEVARHVLQEIVVTGSRIKREQIEGPAPVTVITSEEMARQGFTTAYEALATLTQQTGTVTTQVTPTAATPNAAALNLRGLGPGRVLVLFNGHRAADYPLPFEGRSNIVNLRAIPVAALERVEILSGGASAIYGSDAVSGVVNFIMRDHFDGIAVDARLGGTSHGDAQSQRAQLTGGINGSAFKAVYAFEYLHREPLFALDSPFIDSLARDPTGIGASSLPVNILYSVLGGQLIDPTPAVCEQYGPDVSLQEFAGLGSTCGDPTGPAQFTIRNETRDLSGFFNSTYDFGDGLQAFGSLSLWYSRSGLHTPGPSWSPPEQIIFDAANFDYLIPQRFFTLAETTRDPNIEFDEFAWDTAVGLRGKLFDRRYDWELTYHHSGYEARRDTRELLAQAVSDYFLGAPSPGPDPLGLGAPVYEGVRRDRLLQPVSPADYDSLSAMDRTRADSSNDQLSAVFTGKAFQLPAGAVEFAGVLELATQQYDIRLDPGVASGRFHGVNNAFPGGGDRDRYAAGIELAVPLAQSVRLTMAGRYDRYNDVTDVDDAITYNAGLEFRPVKNLLLRAAYATSFRAPDMQFVFAGASTTSQGFLDVLRCRRDFGVTDLGQCTSPQASLVGQFISRGNTTLREEKGRSWTAGLVWNVGAGVDVSVDYYDIRLKNLVDDLSTDYILRTEADCRLGSTLTGQAVDPGSALCQFIGGLVTRHVPSGVGADTIDYITAVTAEPINRALLSTSGIDATFRYQLETSRLGKFFYKLGWTHVLTEDRQEFAADPAQPFRDDPTNRNLRSRINTSLSWQLGAFSQTLFADIQGSRPRFSGGGRTHSFKVFNYTASYDLTRSLNVGLIVDNLFDTDPRIDSTFSSYPYFYSSNVNPYGREIFVEARYRFR